MSHIRLARQNRPTFDFLPLTIVRRIAAIDHFDAAILSEGMRGRHLFEPSFEAVIQPDDFISLPEIFVEIEIGRWFDTIRKRVTTGNASKVIPATTRHNFDRNFFFINDDWTSIGTE